MNKKQLRNHIFSWILVSIYLNVTNPLRKPLIAQIIGSGLIMLNYAFVFYLTELYILPKFWKKSWSKLIIAFVWCLIQFWINYYTISIYIIPFVGGSTYYQTAPIKEFLFTTLIYFNISASAGIALFFNRYSLSKIKIQAEKERSLLIKELSYLKNQFNSHITFNFFNYCYSKLHKKLPEVANSIDIFSEMLRYTLQTKSNQKVSLEEELKYIENFVDLQKLLNPDIHAEILVDGSTKNHFIMPRALVTIVENAYNFCDLNNQIHIEIILKNKFLILVKYKIKSTKEEVAIRAVNDIKPILEIFYPNQYKLSQYIVNSICSTELEIFDYN